MLGSVRARVLARASLLGVVAFAAAAAAQPPIAAATATPLVTAFSYSPSSVDVSSGSASVTFTAHLTDGSIITQASVGLYGPSNGDVTSPLTLVSGSAQDGVWQGTVTVPRGAQAGTWDYEAMVYDGVNSYSFGSGIWAGPSQPAFLPGGLTVDDGSTTSPQAPTITSPSDNSYDNTHTVVLSGTAEANSKITVYDGTSSVAGATTDGTGNWTATLSGVPDGAHTYSATATDAGGKTSPASIPVDLTVDTAAPSPPTIGSPADDSYVNTHTVVLSGTAEAKSTITVYDGTDWAARATTNASGSWTATVTGVSDGAHTYTATATDVAGNTSSASTPVHVTVDTVAPAAPAITSPADNSYNNDHVHELTLSGTGTANSTITIYDGTAWAGSTNGGDNWSLTLNAGEGPHTYTATATDAAGNVSPASSPVHVTIDTIAPASPTIASPADNSTETTHTVVLSGAAEASSAIAIYDGTTWSGGATASAGGNWTVTLNGVADGAHAYYATSTDAAGNTSPSNTTVHVTVDAPPDAPVVASPADNGYENTDRFTISGTADANTTITVDDGTVAVGSGTTNASGNWTVTMTGVADGAHDYTATATYGAMTGPPSSAVHVTVDTVPPAAPTMTSPTDDSHDATHTVTLSGAAEAKSTIIVYDGMRWAGSATTNGAGNWTVTLTGVLNGTHSYTVTATDAAGNTSPASPVVHVIEDSQAPVTSITTVSTDQSSATASFASSESNSTFECRLTGPSQPDGFTSCTSPVTYGALPAGSYKFTVRATDQWGNTDPNPPSWSFTIPGTVPGTQGTSAQPRTPVVTTPTQVAPTSLGNSAPAQQPGAKAPARARVSALRLSPSAFFAAASGPSASASSRRTGATVSFKLRRSSRVRFVVQASVAGHLSRGRCVAQSRSSTKQAGPRCTVFTTLAGSFTWTGRASLNRFHFSGRLRGQELRPGLYRLVATSADGSRARTDFRIR